MKARTLALLAIAVCGMGYFVMASLADEREINELREKAAALMRLEEEGRGGLNEGEIVRLRKQASAMLREADELEKHRERREIEERERIERDEPRERHEGVQEQINHIRTAAEHLHAAGMHELAEDLMRQAQERTIDFERQQHSEGEGEQGERLQRHVEELSQHVRELHGRLERMEKAIRELSDRRDR